MKTTIIDVLDEKKYNELLIDNANNARVITSILHTDNNEYQNILNKAKKLADDNQSFSDVGANKPRSISPLFKENIVYKYVYYSNELYEVEDVPRDGNCFFHVVSRQTGIDHQEIRRMVIDHLLENPDMYNFEVLEQKIDETQRESIERYIDSMSREGTWADHMAIQAMANLGYRINIFGEEQNIVINPSNYNIAIQLPSINIQYVSDNHFRSLTLAASEEMFFDIRSSNQDQQLVQNIPPVKKVTMMSSMLEAIRKLFAPQNSAPEIDRNIFYDEDLSDDDMETITFGGMASIDYASHGPI